MNFKRIIAWLLVLAVLFITVIACSEENDVIDNSDEEETTATAIEKTTIDPLYVCEVPEDLTLEGETFSVLLFKETEGQIAQTFLVNADELNGEIVNDAVYNANLTVSNALDFTYEFIDNGGNEITRLSNAINAGDDIYDVVYGTQWKVAPGVLNSMFANISDTDYINTDKVWWYKNYINEACVDSERAFFLAGQPSPDILRRSSIIIVNSDMLDDYNTHTEELYDHVFNGTWTLETMSGYISQCYEDLNGNGKKDGDDRLGYGIYTRSDVDHLLIGAGINGCSRDEDGLPYLDFYNANSIECVEKLYDLFWNNSGSYYVEQLDVFNMLSANNILMFCCKFSNLDLMRDIETKFSILPVPKLNENIENHRALIHDDAIIVCIPSISENVSATSAVLEKMACVYYSNVLPAYYEIALKTKYSRDSSGAAIQVIDLIHDNLTTDFAYIYNYAMNNLIISLRDLIGITKERSLASGYAENEQSYNAALEKLLGALNA